MSAGVSLRKQVLAAVRACEDKSAQAISILEMEKNSGAFTDYFVLASGANPRQIQAIADSVEEKLRSDGLRPTHSEGYQQAEWVLLDYVDFVVHVFSERARRFYDLERLWRSARRLSATDLARVTRKRAGSRKSSSRATKAAKRKAARPGGAKSPARRRRKSKP